MKQKITLRTWLSVFFGGIWQFICNIFSWENKTPFWRVIWATITVCVIIVTGLIAYSFFEYESEKAYKAGYYSYIDYDQHLSDNYKFYNAGHNSGKSFIYNANNRKKVMKGIDWIAIPEDGDSLIIVAKDGKRGFVNRFTAEIAIPFKYDAAWSFTDGVAAVCEENMVFFIDHNGNPINDKKFPRKRGYDNYVYHGYYAAIPSNEKYGLVDRNGEWVVQPEYDDIHIGPKNMWYAMNNDKWGVIGVNGDFVFPTDYKGIWIHSNNGITLVNENNSQSRYDYDGTLIDNFVFDEIYEMAYYINEFDDEGNQKQAVDNMMKYSTGSYYGLITRNGIPVTPPLYSSISSVAPGVYQCQIPDTYECIMINSKGEKIND